MPSEQGCQQYPHAFHIPLALSSISQTLQHSKRENTVSTNIICIPEEPFNIHIFICVDNSMVLCVDSSMNSVNDQISLRKIQH